MSAEEQLLLQKATEISELQQANILVSYKLGRERRTRICRSFCNNLEDLLQNVLHESVFVFLFFIKNKCRNFSCKSVYGVRKCEASSSSWFIPSSSASMLNSKTRQLIRLKTRFVNLFVSRAQVFSTCMQKLNSPCLETFQVTNLACLRATYLLVLRPGIPVPGRNTNRLQSGSALEQTSLESKDGGFLSNWTCPFRSFAHDRIAVFWILW